MRKKQTHIINLSKQYISHFSSNRTYLRLEERGGVAQGAGVALHALAPEPGGLALGQAGHS